MKTLPTPEALEEAHALLGDAIVALQTLSAKNYTGTDGIREAQQAINKAVALLGLSASTLGPGIVNLRSDIGSARFIKGSRLFIKPLSYDDIVALQASRKRIADALAAMGKKVCDELPEIAVEEISQDSIWLWGTMVLAVLLIFLGFVSFRMLMSTG